ncbi:MAG: HEAT repeat domain-containing protein [Cyclobacteriaceae bacterium]
MNILQGFIAFLGGQKGEEKAMWLLLGKGFFMGIFIATYQIGAEVLFIHELGETLMDTAFFAAGVAGVFSTVMYVWLQKHIRYSILLMSNIFIILLFVVGLRIGYYVYPWEYWSFLQFVMIGPATTIIILGFWGAFGRIFDLRQSKRIVGGIDTGQLSATVLTFFSIPIIQGAFDSDTHDLLIVATIGCFGVFFFTIWLVRAFNLDSATQKKQGDKEVRKVSFFDLFKDKYLRMMCVFLAFSMGAGRFIEFSFLTSVEVMYPDEDDLKTFLSFFSGIVMIFSFIFQSFINDIIIGKYGLRISLMVMPFVLVLFTMGAIVSGHIFGYLEKNDDYLYFFLFVTMGNLFTLSLKDALESPAFKLFFLPLDIKIRFDIQSRIEGVVSEMANLATGGILIAMGFVSWVKLIHYSYFVIFLSAFVVYFADKLFQQYKRTLKIALEGQKEKLKGRGSKNEHNTVNLLKSEIEEEEPETVITALKLMERMEPVLIEESLIHELDHPDPAVRRFAYHKLGELNCFDYFDDIAVRAKRESDDEAKKEAAQALKTMEAARDFKLTFESARKLVRSTDAENRVLAAKVLRKLDDEKYIPLMVELLRDINPRVRNTAIVTAGVLHRPELWPILIENLSVSAYSNSADSALISAGEPAFHTVDTAFYKTGQYLETMIRVVQILGRIGGRRATDLLWKKVEFPDRRIVSKILLALSYNGYNAKDFQAARIKIAIEERIGDIAWNIKALQDIPEETELDEELRSAMADENTQAYENIYMLLAMIYDPQSVQLVRENFKLGTTDSIAFAMESLDIFLEDELKPKLFPIMDEIEVDERLEKLLNFYPPEQFESYADLLLQIINRDYNHINRYTKAVATQRLVEIEGTEVTDDLIANLFNPDPLILETTAWAIYRLNKNEYHSQTNRINPTVKRDLDKQILPPVFRDEDEDYHQKQYKFEITLRLKKLHLFKGVSGLVLADVAECVEEIKLGPDHTIIEKGSAGDEPIYLPITGKVKLHDGDQVKQIIEPGTLIGEKNIVNADIYDYSATTIEESILLVLAKDDLYDLMSKNIELVEAFLGVIDEDEEIIELDEDLYANQMTFN